VEVDVGRVRNACDRPIDEVACACRGDSEAGSHVTNKLTWNDVMVSHRTGAVPGSPAGVEPWLAAPSEAGELHQTERVHLDVG
jgi:hypothetical protein